MIFDYVAEMGLPEKNEIVFNGSRLFTEYTKDDGDGGQSFYVVNLHSGLKLVFSAKDGYLVGLESREKSPDGFTRAELGICGFTDGRVRAVRKDAHFFAGRCYLDFIECGSFYDEANGLIIFGDCDKASFTVRACTNLFFSFDGAGVPVAVTVQLLKKPSDFSLI